MNSPYTSLLDGIMWFKSSSPDMPGETFRPEVSDNDQTKRPRGHFHASPCRFPRLHKKSTSPVPDADVDRRNPCSGAPAMRQPKYPKCSAYCSAQTSNKRSDQSHMHAHPSFRTIHRLCCPQSCLPSTAKAAPVGHSKAVMALATGGLVAAATCG